MSRINPETAHKSPIAEKILKNKAGTRILEFRMLNLHFMIICHFVFLWLFSLLKGFRAGINLTIFISILFLFPPTGACGEEIKDSDSVKINKRAAFVYTTGAAGYFGSMYLLNNLWYKDYPRSGFHFFNDNAEWLQMDKVGHSATAYHVSLWGMDVMRWTGASRKKSIWIGGLAGPFYMTTIEVLDGFSAGWGASPGDFIANTLGSALSIGQELAWEQQRVILKWSFHKTQFAKYRPDLLGSNLPERLLKDYNGQTYWLSFNLKSVFSLKKFPNWLNLAVGYSADGMTGSFKNATEYKSIPIPSYTRRREFLVSLDVDLKKIKTKSKLLSNVFNAFGFLKIPAPAILYSGRKLSAYPLYY